MKSNTSSTLNPAFHFPINPWDCPRLKWVSKVQVTIRYRNNNPHPHTWTLSHSCRAGHGLQNHKHGQTGCKLSFGIWIKALKCYKTVGKVTQLHQLLWCCQDLFKTGILLLLPLSWEILLVDKLWTQWLGLKQAGLGDWGGIRRKTSHRGYRWSKYVLCSNTSDLESESDCWTVSLCGYDSHWNCTRVIY